MGLDWFVQPKVVDGRTIEPAETAGRKELDPRDPEAIELLERLHEAHRNFWPDPGPRPAQPPAPEGLKALLAFFSRAARRRKRDSAFKLRCWQNQKEQHELYQRPLEQVIPLLVTGDPPVVVRDAAPDRQDALAGFIGTGDCYDFRGMALRDDINAVTAHAAYVMKMEFTDELYLDREPPEMLELADDLSRALGHYLKNEDDKDQDSIDAIRAAIPWLRFWARAGHGFVSDY